MGYENRFHNFALLCAASFGLAKALKENPSEVSSYFNKSYSAAVQVLQLTKQSISTHSRWYACATDNSFATGQSRAFPSVFLVGSFLRSLTAPKVCYAAVSLLRMCRPKYQCMHSKNAFILDLVGSTADALYDLGTSPQSSARQYSIFIRALVKAHLNNPSGETMPPTPRPASPIAAPPAAVGVPNTYYSNTQPYLPQPPAVPLNSLDSSIFGFNLAGSGQVVDPSFFGSEADMGFDHLDSWMAQLLPGL